MAEKTQNKEGHWAYPSRHDLDRFIEALPVTDGLKKELSKKLDDLESDAYCEGMNDEAEAQAEMD